MKDGWRWTHVAFLFVLFAQLIGSSHADPDPEFPTAGTLDTDSFYLTPGKTVRVFGTGWATIFQECEYDFFFDGVKVADQGPDVGLFENPDRTFTVPNKPGLRKIRVDLLRTHDQVVVASREISRCVTGTIGGTIEMTKGLRGCPGGQKPGTSVLLATFKDDTGNTVEIFCTHSAIGFQYEAFFLRVQGGAVVIGTCRYPRGLNLGYIYHTGDANGNGIPDCFLETRWENEEPDLKDTDGDGKVNFDVYAYDAVTNTRKYIQMEKKSTPVPFNVIETSDPSQLSVPPAPPIAFMDEMSFHSFHLADMNRDGLCNAADIVAFNSAFGSTLGDPNWNPFADLTNVGVIDSKDADLINLALLERPCPEVDETPPVIVAISATPDVLWPPNHKLVPVTVSVTAVDDVDPSPTCKIVSVTSSEPENGLGDGDMAPDSVITGDLTVSLRAERSGRGTGRVYTITVVCSDAAGNSSQATVEVRVPHDQRK